MRSVQFKEDCLIVSFFFRLVVYAINYNLFLFLYCFACLLAIMRGQSLSISTIFEFTLRNAPNKHWNNSSNNDTLVLPKKKNSKAKHEIIFYCIKIDCPIKRSISCMKSTEQRTILLALIFIKTKLVVGKCKRSQKYSNLVKDKKNLYSLAN